MKALNILIYCSNVARAITIGCKAVWANWPNHNPFGDSNKSNVPIREQQIESDQPDNDQIEPVQEPEKILDSSSKT